MIKILKSAVKSLGVVIVLAVLLVGALVTFVSPNRFKPVIVEQVMKYTGRQLVIEGDLSWTVFPYLGIKIGHTQLNNPAGFSSVAFAEINSATVSVKLLPLLSGKIESNGVKLDGLILNLIKNAEGKTNWQDLQQNASPEKAQTTSSNKVGKTTLALAVSGIDISDANINWVDEQKKQLIKIGKFELHAKNISLEKSFPLSAAFTFVTTNPVVSGQASLHGQINLDLNKQLYELKNLDVALAVHQGEKNYKIVLKGNAVADLIKNTLQMDDLIANVNGLTAAGKTTVNTLTSHPQITGHLQIQPVDMKKWLQATGQDVVKLQVLKDLKANFDFSLQEFNLQGIYAKGDIAIEELRFDNITATKLTVPIILQNSIVDFSPISALFYQGTVQSTAKIVLNAAVPQITLQAKLVNIQAEPLLADLSNPNEKIKIAGAGNINLQVTMAGATGDAIVRSLNGGAQFSFNNGVVKGIDLGYLVDTASALIQQQAPTAQDAKQTSFGTLTGTAVIHNGVASNNDLRLDSPRFDTKGSGDINLVTQQINYQLQLTIKQIAENQDKNNLRNLYGVILPIRISGSLNNPNVSLDSRVLIKAITNKQIDRVKDKARDRIKEEIQKNVPGQAGEMLQNLLGQ